ncbi:MAG TPA: dienelactone hydrolase family protein [Burkholderiaceae bacterium]|nr:dienelactone hydrolase family protein [Burkholderiaceae bacterium]
MTSPVIAKWIQVEAAEPFDAYLALPPAGSGPGLVLFQEIFGVNAHIRAVAEQYALAGFVVLAPDVFWRQQRRVELGYEGEDMQRALAFTKGMDREALLRDIGSSVTALRARPEVGSHKVGAIGYCMGGRLAYLAAATTDIDAAVPYYGGGIHDNLERAASIRCPVQFHYAGIDNNIPPEAVEKVRAAMAGKAAEFHVYPGAHHGFNCWARASYHAPSAALAHGRALQFLAQHLF